MRALPLTVFTLLCLTTFLISCSSAGEGNQVSKSETEVETSDAEKATSLFPVYESFAEVESIFHQSSDTTYVINFWATWCKPCVKELPYFEALHEQFEGKKLKVILVSLDFKKDIEPKLRPFVEEKKLKSDIIALTDHKYNEWIDKVDPEWGGAIPVTVIYNSEKRQFIGESFANEEELTTMVKEMINKTI